MNKSLLFKIISLAILIFNVIIGCILITFMCFALFKVVVLNSLYLRVGSTLRCPLSFQ